MFKKSLLIMLLMALFMPWAAKAQQFYAGETGLRDAYEVQIGEGTSTSGYFPFYTLYNYSIAECLFLASELEEAGVLPGDVTSLSWYATNETGQEQQGISFWMANVDDEGLTTTSHVTTDMTLVYTGSVTPVTGWNEFEFNEATFTWDGTSNVLIFCQRNNGAWNSTINWQATANMSFNCMAYRYQDSGAYDPTVANTMSTSTTRPNIIIKGVSGGVGPTCARPTEFDVDYQGGSTATVTWRGEASQYNIEVNGVVTPGVTSPYTFNVEPATSYTVRVQADCGDGLTSGWTSSQSFFTPCEAIDIPYTYGFEDANELNCWNVIYSSNTPGITTTSVYEGSNSFRFSSYSSASNYDQYLISPQLNVAANGVGVSFYYAGYSYGTETFKVGYSTTTNDPDAFTWGDEISVTGTSWQMFEENYPAGTKFVGIYYYSNYQYYMYVDNFSFDVPNSCRKPTDLAASDIDKRSAKLSWTENGEATSWNLKVNGQLIEGVNNPHTLNNLTPETEYTVQVCPVCEVEKWSDEITFTTLVACPTPELNISALTPFAATMSWEGSAQRYDMEYMADATYHFEDGLDGWTNITVIDTGGMWIHSANNGGGYDYTTHAHSGTGFAMCYSFIDYVGSYNTDAYLVSPRNYQINEGASLNFWYDMANDTYPEYFEVCVATAANPTASDFTAIWTYGSKGVKNEKAMMRQSNNRYDNWREVTVDLSDYAGQTIWIAFHDVNEDSYEVWIDDVLVNNGTAGEWISAPAPVTSPYTLTPLESETDYVVRLRAYCGYQDGYSEWTTVYFTTPSNCDAPIDLEVTNLMPTTATLNWTGYQEGFDVYYRPRIAGSELVNEDFEEGLTWTTIDADGDGFNWVRHVNTGSGNFNTHSGDASVNSGSYDGDSGTALTPDNYLVSPQVELGGSITFWASAQDASWPSEHFGVAVSTTSNTDASAFTTLQEWTMTAKKGGVNTGNYLTRNSGNRASGAWYQYTVDLSDYAGQTGYVAIRHFNCTDFFYLVVDDIIIYGLAGEEAEWEQLSTDGTSLDIEELRPNTEYEWMVRGQNPDCGDEEVTAWSEIVTFTTPGECDLPTDLNAEVTPTTATLTWTGYQDSFDVTYYTAADGDVLINTGVGFSGSSDWTPVTEDEESDFYYLSNDYSYVGYGFSSTSTPQYLISPEFDALEGNSFVEFMYYATGTEENEDLPETFKIGYSTTDAEVASFTFGDTYSVSGIDYIDIDLPEGAKYFAIEYDSDHPADSTYLFVLDFMVVSNYVAAGDPITLTGQTSPVTIEDLEPNTYYRWEVLGISDDCGELETVSSYFLTPEITTITQTVALSVGANWFSAYVDITLDDLKAALVEALPGTEITIQAQKNNVKYNPNNNRWTGRLTTLDLSNMYKISVATDGEFTLEGMPVDPTEHQVTITNGANWIAFPLSESMTPANAFTGFAVSGDRIQSFTNNANYNGTRWTGQLRNLDPGQGYIYQSAAEDTRYFTFPSANKGAKSNGKSMITRSHEAQIEMLKNATIVPIKK